MSHTIYATNGKVSQLHARVQDFTLGGALLGEGSGDRLGPQRVQDSARWETGAAKPPPPP